MIKSYNCDNYNQKDFYNYNKNLKKLNFKKKLDFNYIIIIT